MHDQVRNSLITFVLFACCYTSAHAVPVWTLTHTHAPDVSGATPGALMQSGHTLQVSVSLQVRNKSSFDALTNQVMAGQARPISTQQFMSQFAPSADQVNAVVTHLSQSGFVNIEVSPNHLLITADGSAGAAKNAFNVDMQHFDVQGRAAYANTNDPTVPSHLQGIVLGVHGLQTVHMAHEHLNAMTQAVAGKVGHSPASWPTVYNATSLPAAANASIGIIGSGNVTQVIKDLNTFAQRAGFASPTVSIVGKAGTSGSTSSSALAEWNIDTQNALGAAGGNVKSLILYSASSLTDNALAQAYNAAVASKAATVINVSLGECEISARVSGIEATTDQIFQAAVAQGQTFVVSSGDAGAYECGGSTPAQSYPAVSPYVIAVGGTSLTTDVNGVWAGETVWACSSARTCSRNGGTGGGNSLTEAAPSWQLGSGVLSASQRRGVPDVSFVGDPATGAQTIINGQIQQYGGTSLAAPIFAGFWARIQSANGGSLPFPGAALYRLGVASQASLFHDITSGSNGGFSARTGWDYTTGFGSMNVANFASQIAASGGR